MHLLLIGFYPLITVALGFWKRGEGTSALPSTVGGLLWVCGIELLIFSFVFAGGWMASRASREEMRLRWRPGYWVVPLGAGYSVAIRLAVGLLVMVVSAALLATGIVTPKSLQAFFTENRPQVETVIDIAALRDNPVYYWLSLTFVSFVVAGLREELWRTAVLAAMSRLWPRLFGSLAGQFGAAILIAIVFGAAHANQGIIGATMAGVLGLMLGLIMVWHRSIWPAVLAHGFFDAVSIGLLPWAMEKAQQFGH